MYVRCVVHMYILIIISSSMESFFLSKLRCVQVRYFGRSFFAVVVNDAMLAEEHVSPLFVSRRDKTDLPISPYHALPV